MFKYRIASIKSAFVLTIMSCNSSNTKLTVEDIAVCFRCTILRCLHNDLRRVLSLPPFAVEDFEAGLAKDTLALHARNFARASVANSAWRCEGIESDPLVKCPLPCSMHLINGISNERNC